MERLFLQLIGKDIMSIFNKKVDLRRGYGENNINYTENILQDLIATAVQGLNDYTTKKLKTVLNSVQLTVSNAGKFTSEAEYNNALSVIDTLKEEVPRLDSVSSAIIDNYENTLNAHRKNFVADNQLTSMFNDVKNDLIGLNEFNSSSNLHEILKSLEQLTKEYRPNASANVLKMGDKLHDDVRDAIWVADNLRRVDFDQDTPEWELNNADYKVADELFKWGDFDGAKKYLLKGSKVEESKLWQSAGYQYRGNLNRLIAKQEEYTTMYDKSKGKNATGQDKDNAKALDENSIFRHARFLPRIGKQDLNQYNMDEAKDEINTKIRTIMYDSDNINFGKSEIWAKLQRAYSPEEGAKDKTGNPIKGGPESLYVAIKEEMKFSDKDRYADTEWINYAEMVNFLSENIQFVPDEPGWELSFGKKWNEPIEGSNKLGAEYFMELLKVGLDLEESQKKINSYESIDLGYAMYGNPY